MFDFGYASPDDLYAAIPYRVSVVKNGPIAVENAFALYGLTGIESVDRALAHVMTTPSIADRPFGYLRLDGPNGVEMQFIDVTRSLTRHLLHEDEDADGNTVRTLPDLVLVACDLDARRQNRLFDWSMINGVRAVFLDKEQAYANPPYGRRMDA